jgi:hypothetical protein
MMTKATTRGRIARRALLSGALAVGLVAGGGIAYALWSTQVALTGLSTLTSGSSDLQVTTPDDSVTQPQAAGTGTGYVLPANFQPAEGWFPGTSRATVFTLTNVGNVPLSVNLPIVDFGPNGDQWFQWYGLFGTSVSVTGNGDSEGCAPSPAPDGSQGAQTLAPGSFVYFCLEVSLQPGISGSNQGSSDTMKLDFSATQVAPTP